MKFKFVEIWILGLVLFLNSSEPKITTRLKYLGDIYEYSIFYFIKFSFFFAFKFFYNFLDLKNNYFIRKKVINKYVQIFPLLVI